MSAHATRAGTHAGSIPTCCLPTPKVRSLSPAPAIAANVFCQHPRWLKEIQTKNPAYRAAWAAAARHALPRRVPYKSLGLGSSWVESWMRIGKRRTGGRHKETTALSSEGAGLASRVDLWALPDRRYRMLNCRALAGDPHGCDASRLGERYACSALSNRDCRRSGLLVSSESTPFRAKT